MTAVVVGYVQRLTLRGRWTRSTLAFYRHQGHLTVNGVFAADEMDAVVRDIEHWGESFLAEPAGRSSAAGTSTAASRRAPCCESSTTRTPSPGGAAGRARPAPRRAGRADPRPRRLGLLQPGLLQGRPKAADRSRRTRTTSTSARPTSRASSPPGSRSTTRRSRTAASTSATARNQGPVYAHFAPEASRSTCSCRRRCSTSSR